MNKDRYAVVRVPILVMERLRVQRERYTRAYQSGRKDVLRGDIFRSIDLNRDELPLWVAIEKGLRRIEKEQA